MMRVVIIEDETAAAINLRSMLKRVAPAAEIVAALESIDECVEFFGADDVRVDLVFMDIHLADGDSFRVFDSVTIDAPIIFTTAYDQYALQAFKVNSIDYLLKPFKEEDLQRALDKLARLSAVDLSAQKAHVAEMVASRTEPTRTILVRFKDKIIPVSTDGIAFFYTFSEKVSLTTLSGESYPADKTLETLQGMLPEEEFFRANRQFIVSRAAVKDIAVWFGSRLALNLTVDTPERIIISKARVPEFKQWLTSSSAGGRKQRAGNTQE